MQIELVGTKKTLSCKLTGGTLGLIHCVHTIYLYMWIVGEADRIYMVSFQYLESLDKIRT